MLVYDKNNENHQKKREIKNSKPESVGKLNSSFQSWKRKFFFVGYSLRSFFFYFVSRDLAECDKLLHFPICLIKVKVFGSSQKHFKMRNSLT